MAKGTPLSQGTIIGRITERFERVPINPKKKRLIRMALENETRSLIRQGLIPKKDIDRIDFKEATRIVQNNLRKLERMM